MRIVLSAVHTSTVLTLLALLAGQAAAQPNVLETTPRFATGERFVLEKVATKKLLGSQAADPPDIQATTSIDVTVLAGFGDGFVLEFTMGDTLFDCPNPKTRDKLSDPSVKATIQGAGKAMKGFRLEVELDARGQIKELRNWKEVQAKGDQFLDAMLSGVSSEEAAKTRQAMHRLLESRQMIESAWLQDVQLFVAPLGRRFTVGESQKYAGQLPNPLGGAPIAAQGEIKVTVNQAKAFVAYTAIIDPKAAAQASRQALEKMRPGAGAQLPADLALDARDEGTFTINVPESRVESVGHVVTIKMPGATDRMVDSTTITRKPAR